MSGNKLDFAALDWEISESGLKSKCFEKNGKRVRLLEHSSAVREENWCERAHCGYVVEGELEIDFLETGRETVRKGEGIFIESGIKHKANSLSGKSLLFLVEEIE